MASVGDTLGCILTFHLSALLALGSADGTLVGFLNLVRLVAFLLADAMAPLLRSWTT